MINPPSPAAQAIWFLEVEGQKQGPYTSSEILKLVSDGALTQDSKIFDSTTAAWKEAREVIPYLDLDAPSSSVGEIPLDWQPPPRPPELKDFHIVDLNEEITAGADYFALIGERKKELERVRPTKAPTAAKTNKAAVQAPKPASVEAKPAALKLEKIKIDAADGILSAEEVPSLSDSVASGLRGINVREFVHKNKIPLSVAAGLSVVFAGSYGVLSMLAQKGAREPARAASTQSESAPKPSSNFFANPYAAPGGSGSGSAPSELGTGRHRIERASGGVNGNAQNTATARVATPPPPSQAPNIEPPQNNENRAEPPREGPQFYSSASDPEVIGNVAEMPPQPMNPSVQQPPQAQTQDLVDPPAYIPYQDPNSQFREPTADPNAQPPNDPAQQPPQQSPEVYN